MAKASITYTGTPANVPAARHFVRGILAESPRVDDLELIAAELITNAICHTPSGQDGGNVTLTIRRAPRSARLEVADQGSGRWSVAPCDHSGLAERGRGLEIVAALADDMGRCAVDGAQVVWAEVTWLGLLQVPAASRR